MKSVAKLAAASIQKLKKKIEYIFKLTGTNYSRWHELRFLPQEVHQGNTSFHKSMVSP
jgi:hypothetical protein